MLFGVLMSFKMSSEEFKIISLLNSLTGVLAKDCIVDKENDRIIFVVNKEDSGKVIGKGGEMIRRLRIKMNKEIDIVSYSEKVEEFAVNCVAPAHVENVQINERDSKKYALITVKKSDKGRAIGRGGRTLQRSKLLLKRHYNIDNIVIKT